MAKRMKSEYMKQFKGPQWEIHSSCYSDRLQYRNMRRLLEQAHIPWIWSGWDSDSSSGSSTPRDRAEPISPEPEDSPRPQNQTAAAEPSEPEPQPPVNETVLQLNQKDKDEGQTKSELCVQPALDYHRVRNANLGKSRKAPKLTTPPAALKESKPPFAMFGWAEREAEVGCKKTYNVSASALRGQIYESAVRAQNRRQVQRAMRMPQRRPRGKVPLTTHSSDRQYKFSPGHKSLSEHLQVRVLKPVKEEDPWLSEYMRCYSTRSL
ncbi:centriole, cilia and spindle-associated protein-like [Carcharodon carcharias]|uniref:centriole, cilia and spindle-associated protein-like n=1 Tax=Carcharodon carcharias TaxID=13397 RepID=UPI001B7F23E0|nr:centriole, cilia and spindle-associated protein-like [Carcharodon carcharias]